MTASTADDHQVMRDIRTVMILTAGVNVLNLVRNIAVARLLGPLGTGICLSLQVIPQTASYVSLGVVDALTLVVPSNRDTGELASRRTKSIVGTFHMSVSLLVTLGVSLYAWVTPDVSTEIRAHTWLAALLILAVQASKFSVTDLAADRQFTTLGWVEMAYTFVLLVTTVVFISWWGGYGFWLSLILSNVLVVLYSYETRIRPQRLRLLRVPVRELGSMVPLGLVMILTSSIYSPFIILSKLLIARSMGFEAVGAFFPSIVVVTLMALVPRTLMRVLLPHASALLGCEKQVSVRVFALYTKVQGVSLTLAFGAAIVGVLALGPAVRLILPAYEPGIATARYLLVACIPYCLIDNANAVLIVTGQKRVVLRLFAYALASLLAVFGFLLIAGVSLAGVAVALGGVFLIYAAGLNHRIFALKTTAA